MTETAVATKDDAASILERVVVGGDLSQLSAHDRVVYYKALCDSVGLNPLTKPFDYLQLSGKLVLYAKKECTEQLRKKHRISITKLERETIEDVYCVTAYATDKEERTDSSIGAVNIGTLRGESKANAFMKAETKAKRRVTLSICGLGLLDESEVEDALMADALKGIQTNQTEVTRKPAQEDGEPSGLFGEPDELNERAQLVGEFNRLNQKLKLTGKRRLDLFEKHLGERTGIGLGNAPLAHVKALVDELKAEDARPAS